MRPGARNLITDVAGLVVGNAEEHGHIELHAAQSCFQLGALGVTGVPRQCGVDRLDDVVPPQRVEAMSHRFTDRSFEDDRIIP